MTQTLIINHPPFPSIKVRTERHELMEVAVLADFGFLAITQGQSTYLPYTVTHKASGRSIGQFQDLDIALWIAEKLGEHQLFNPETSMGTFYDQIEAVQSYLDTAKAMDSLVGSEGVDIRLDALFHAFRGITQLLDCDGTEARSSFAQAAGKVLPINELPDAEIPHTEAA